MSSKYLHKSCKMSSHIKEKGTDIEFSGSFDRAILNQIQNEKIRQKLGSFAQQALDFFCDMVMEFGQLETELRNYKARANLKTNGSVCEECSELKKRISVQDVMLSSLGSSIVKVNETRQLDDHISEVFKILFEILPTPPPEQERPSPEVNIKTEPTENTSHRKQCDSVSQQKFMLKSHSEDTKESKRCNKRKTPELDVKLEEELVQSDCSDVSINDESISEIYETPTGRISPVLGTRVMRSRQPPHKAQKSSSKSASPVTKLLKLSTRAAEAGPRGGRGRLIQTRLSLVKPTRRLDLTGSEEFGGGVRGRRERSGHPKLDEVRTSVEDEDVILPSPTSETIRNSFSATVPGARVSVEQLPAHPPPPAPAPPSPDAHAPLAWDVDFDEPTGTEVAPDGRASPNLLDGFRQGVVKVEATSPVLRETPHDTNVSVSVLRAPRPRHQPRPHPRHDPRDRAHRENVPPPAARTTKKQTLKETCPPPPRDADVVSPPGRCGDAATAGYEEQRDPQRSGETTHVYKEETVRRKADKLKLPGWSCQQCRDYYGVVYKDEPAELRRMMEECSRHRGRWDPARAATPPGFWNMHLSAPDDTDQLNRLNGAHCPRLYSRP